MDYFYNRCLHVYPGFADAPGYRTPSTIRAGLTGQISKNASLTRAGLTWKDFVNDGYIIAGSPATVRDQLREALKSLNCGHLMILQQIGSMPPELVRKSTDLFAREVMPHLRDLWTGFEDKWSPKRLPANEMAVPAPIWSDGPTTNGKTQRPGASEIRSSVK